MLEVKNKNGFVFNRLWVISLKNWALTWRNE